MTSTRNAGWHVEPSADLDHAGWADHFDKFAESYNEIAFQGAGLSWLSRQELRDVFTLLGDVRDRTVLDAGCGTGRLVAELTKRGARTIGLDASDEMLERARLQAGPDSVFARAVLGQELPLADESLDAAVCLRVMKYVPDWEVAANEFHRVLKPGAPLVVEVSNAASLARWGYPHAGVRLVTEHEARTWLASAGFEIFTVRGGSRLPHELYRRAGTPLRRDLVRTAEAVLELPAMCAGRSTTARRSLILGALRRH